MQVELNSGAQIAGSKTRDFWTNPNEDDCNIVFTHYRYSIPVLGVG